FAGRDEPQIADQDAVAAQRQMPRLTVAAVEIRVGRGLLDDKDRLTELQQLIQHRGGQLVPAMPLQLHAARRRIAVQRRSNDALWALFRARCAIGWHKEVSSS